MISDHSNNDMCHICTLSSLFLLLQEIGKARHNIQFEDDEVRGGVEAGGFGLVSLPAWLLASSKKLRVK